MALVQVPQNNITLVALLADNGLPELAGLVGELVKILGQAPDAFCGYETSQMHATVLGMEVIMVGGVLCNAHFLNNNGRLRPVDYPRLLHLLDVVVSTRNPVFRIRFGGFRKAHCDCTGLDLCDWKCPSGNSEFHAFNRSAYEASFFSGSKGEVMLTGWPVARDSVDSFPRDLYLLRRAAEDCGYLAKAHTNEKPYWKDDDFHLRLGTFDFNKCTTGQLQSVVGRVRDYLASRPPMVVDVGLDDLFIVHYEKPTLHRCLAKLPLGEVLRNPQLLADLHQDWTQRNPCRTRN